jgi:hypothetical protein
MGMGWLFCYDYSFLLILSSLAFHGNSLMIQARIAASLISI